MQKDTCLEKRGTQVVKKFSVFYGNLQFPTVFKIVPQLSISRTTISQYVLSFTPSLFFHFNLGDEVSQQHTQEQNYYPVYMDTNILGSKLKFKGSWSDSQHLFREFNSRVSI
jgi:hypothetical protein